MHGLTPHAGGLLMALLAQTAAAGVATSDGAVFLENSKLLAWCIIGCISGAFLKVGLFPPKRGTDERNLRQLSFEFAMAILAGFCLTPMSFHYTSLPRTPEFALGISCLVAIVATGVIHAVAPYIEKVAINRAKHSVDSSNVLKSP